MLIGLVGRKRSGKDTVAGFLAQEYGFERFAFAGPMRTVVKALDPYIDVFGTRLSDVSNDEEFLKEHYPEHRRLMQRLGTEGMREQVGEEFWVDLLFKRSRGVELVVVSDVRFPNEAKAIKGRHGSLVKIERPGEEPLSKHASEIYVDDIKCDATIVNDGSLGELLRNVHSTFAML